MKNTEEMLGVQCLCQQNEEIEDFSMLDLFLFNAKCEENSWIEINGSKAEEFFSFDHRLATKKKQQQ